MQYIVVAAVIAPIAFFYNKITTVEWRVHKSNAEKLIFV